MKKWIALFVVGGAFSALGAGGAAPEAHSGVIAAPAVVGSEPCPSCCPPEICTYNGPSFDGTTKPTQVERSRQ